MGAIDGTLIRVKFYYVLAGWEGSASDSRIVKEALYSREDKLIVPFRKYYLGDVGYMLKSSLITPYRGVRYHLKEYSAHGPENLHEWFNHRHASLRNVIERAFGVWKKRFAMIEGTNEPHYSRKTLTKVILACCITHNFLMSVDHDFNQSLIEHVDMELAEGDVDVGEASSSNQDSINGAEIRDAIAFQMWNDYVDFSDSSSSFVVIFTGNILEMGKCKNMEAPSSAMLRWTVRMDNVLNEVACGNRINGQSTSQAYVNIIKECSEKLDYPSTKDNLKNRLKTIKSNFYEAFDLFGASSWGWNEATQMFENEDEVWDSLLVEKP